MIGCQKYILVIVVALWLQPLVAVETNSFSSAAEIPKALDLDQVNNDSSLEPLAKLKWLENKSEWTACLSLAQDLQTDQTLGVWVKHTFLKCLYRSARAKKIDTETLVKAFVEFKGFEEILHSPFSGHRERLLKTYLKVVKAASEKKTNGFSRLISAGSPLLDFMDSDQRAKFYQSVGEAAFINKNEEVAINNFLRSYSLKASATVKKRLQELKQTPSQNQDKYTHRHIDGPGELSDWARFQKAMKKGQSLQVASLGVEFLNKYPGSHRAPQVEAGVNTFFKRVLYLRGAKHKALKKDFEETLLRAPAQSLLIWATEAYQRGYQDSTYRLAAQAVEGLKKRRQAPEALLLAGRSAYYLSQRKRAQEFFETLIEKHSGHELTGEARYLLGLLYYREQAYQKLIPLYEKFLTSEASDRWELQVRYWLWRSLVKLKDQRAGDVAKSLLKNFPLTYYGLIVRMETQGGLQSLWSETPREDFELKVWWPEHLNDRYTRIKNLLTHGWVSEAEREILYLPDPHTAAGFLFRAKLWQAANLSPRVLQDYSSALHLDESLFSQQILTETFPQLYKNEVLKAQKEFDIEQSLIWAVMRQESAFMPRAISPSRAYGLMQMLAPTARETARWLRVRNFNVKKDIFDPAINIRFGTHFLSRMMKKYKGIAPLGVASYNVGPGNLDRWLSYREDFKWEEVGAHFDDDIWVDELPWAETSYYVKAVMRNHLLYQVIHEGKDKLAAPAWESSDEAQGERLPSESEEPS